MDGTVQAARQPNDASNWRRRLKAMRTLAQFKAADAEPRLLTEAAEALDPDALQAAAENPDHSEAARTAASTVLKARGGASGRWRLRVPGFITGVHLDRGNRLFFGFGRFVRKWSGIGVFAILAGVLAASPFAPPALSQAALENGPSVTVDLFGRHVKSDDLFAGIGAAMLACVVVWFLGTTFRRKPARVLLLRKFNVRHIGNALAAMIQTELRPYGHVTGLADKHIRHDWLGFLSIAMLSVSNPLALIWFVVSAPARFLYRLLDRSSNGPATVLNARDYRNVAKRLRDRIGLNLETPLTSKESYLVRTSDAWWKMTARLLMDSADAIVVDVSQISQGMAWELDAIRSENASARCVFVALWGKADAAQVTLNSWGFPNPLHAYAPDGHMLDRAKFRAAMLGAMRASLE